MSKNRVRVNIAGSSYTILSEESEDYVHSIGEEVDAKISDIKKSSSDISSLMAAILTAMDFCDLYKKSIANNNGLEDESKETFNANESLRKENNALRARINNLEMKLNSINMKKHGKF